jgi:hypothetical protein
MNQKVIIYIILSGLLLYLYYRTRDITIFASFIVVVTMTMFENGVEEREGLKNSGKRSGDGSTLCSNIGFKVPNIKNDDIIDGLESAMKNIETVADNNWPFKDINGNEPKTNKAKSSMEMISNNAFIKRESKKIEEDKEKQEAAWSFALGSAGMYEVFITKPDEKKQKSYIKDFDSKFLTKAIKGGETYLSLLKNNHDHLKKEYKALEAEFDKDVKKLSNYMICLCRQWISIWKSLQKAKGSND